jgi:hypothetical protein
MVHMRLEKLSGTMQEVMEVTGQSRSMVKVKLANGTYRARKNGRRVLIEMQSVYDDWERLPVAVYAPLRTKKSSVA